MKQKYIIAIAALLGASATVSAQNTNSGYFVENYAYRYQMNPAFDNEDNLIGFPGISNINVGLEGSLHLRDVLYNVDGKTVLFTNPNVSTTEAMKNLKDGGKIGSSVRLDLINVGFKALGGYNTVGINLKANVNAAVPGEFFQLAKEGVENRTYDISGFGAHANAYAEVALGHSHKINDKWRFGATLKFLFGAGNVDAYLNTAELQLDRNNWIARTDAILYSTIKGLKYKTKYSDKTGREYVSGADINDCNGPTGFGMGLDVGTVFTPNNDWQFSAAVLDFGWISWNNTQVASTNGMRTIETDAYTFNVDGDAPNSFKNEWERMRDNLFDLYQLDDCGNMGSRGRMLAATVNVAAQYTLPCYRKLKFGLLSSTRINGRWTTTEARLSANITPVKWFGADANVAYGTYGTSFGWMLNFKAPIFNLFVGMDHLPGKLAKQGVPLSSNAQVNFGINFLF